MAPKKKPALKLKGDGTSAIKKPAPKRSTPAGKESGAVAKKPPPKKAVGKIPTAIKKETKKGSTKATAKTDSVINDEDMSDKPAGNTRAATKKEPNEEPSRPAGKTVTATSKNPKARSTKPADKTSAAAKEPTSGPVDIPSAGKAPPASPKRKRTTEDKWTEAAHLPVPKLPRLDEGSSPSPSGESRGIRTLEEFASEGWDTSDFNSKLCCVDTVGPSRIPSPFANLAEGADRTMHIVDSHAHPEVRSLFYKIYGDTAPLMSRFNGFPPGAFGACQHHADAEPPKPFVVRPDQPEFSYGLKKENHHTMFLKFHVRKNAETNGLDYFLVNENMHLFIVNGKSIGQKLAAGPLPDFVVVQIEGWVIFWWRTRAAMGHIPEVISQGVKEVHKGGAASAQEGGDNDTAERRSSPSPASAKEVKDTAKEPTHLLGDGEEKSTAEKPTILQTGTNQQDINDTAEPVELLSSWEEILETNVALHRAKRNSFSDGSAAYQIEGYDCMTLENVLSAVATIWEALRSQGAIYAFAGNEVLDTEFRGVVQTSSFEGSGVVGGEENKFIMPLYFSAEEEDTEKYHKGLREKRAKQKGAKTESEKKMADEIMVPEPLGHILLAVAEKGSAQPERVHIEIRDSRPGTTHATQIRERARAAAGIWLGMDVDPIITNVKVVRQPLKIHTCGMFTILNAWAVMLGIPLLKHEQRRKKRHNIGFLEAALEIVNLALAGFMDTETIQAFLNVYGYSEEQDVGIKTTYAVDAVKMSYERLERKLQEEKTKRGGDDPRSKSSTNPAHSPGSTGLQKAVSDSKIQHFMQLVSDATLEQAEYFLEIASGDLDKAVMEFTKHRSSLDDGSAGARAE